MVALVNNRLDYSSIESDLVCPLSKGYKLVAILDKTFVENELMSLFGRNIKRINNKYAIDVKGYLWYQHDNDTWLIEKRD